MGKFSFFKPNHGKSSSTSTHDTTVPTNPFGSAVVSVDPSRSPSPSGFSQMQGRREALQLVKNQVMINYLYQQQANNGWRSNAEKTTEGVMLRTTGDRYVSNPPELIDTVLAASLRDLNVQSAMTVYSTVIRTYIESQPDAVEMPMLNGLAVQIVADVEALARARTHQFAAVIASEALLVVWDDDAINLMVRAKNIEWEVMQLFWTKDPFRTPQASSRITSAAASKKDFNLYGEKQVMDDSSSNLEAEAQAPRARPTILINTFYTTLALLFMMGILGLGLMRLIIEFRYEYGLVPNPYTRFAFMAITPVWMLCGMFFFNVVVTNFSQLIGPVSQFKINSKHYSATKSPRITKNFPHVTIQCPVYKESLQEVIMPTVQSIKQAISTYELQGGSANIFINDDGLQLLSEELRNERISFYSDNGIGWVARPAHDKNPEGFQRRGKFKKASNMNFALQLSCAMEDKLMTIERGEDWTSFDEAEATVTALEEAIADGGNLAWADGNIRIGDYILLIDSDTRVPTDCILDAVSELELSPEVAILQFSSGVMQVVHNYFENCIAFLTKWIYLSIRQACANGDVAPFVGHNAFLRWSAVQDVSFEEHGVTKVWSESHVSEDFDIALRLQMKGYVARLAAWAGEGFKEGVSLTVYDELARWQKYAYGCDELMFNPIRTWLWRGPFTPLFRKFLGSNLPFASKFTIIGYIGSYYAIGSAWILTFANYFFEGWFKGHIDKYYVTSWEVWFCVVIVFSGLGNLSLAVLRYRLGESSFVAALYINLKNMLMLFIFFGGVSMHVSQALLAHFFEINMSWSATAKTLEFTNFFVEVPKTLRKFWFTFLFCCIATAAMIVCGYASFVPYDWHIINPEAIVPLTSVVIGHLLLPLALNPGLMTFAF